MGSQASARSITMETKDDATTLCLGGWVTKTSFLAAARAAQHEPDQQGEAKARRKRSSSQGTEAHTLRHGKRSPLKNRQAHLSKHLLHRTPIAGCDVPARTLSPDRHEMKSVPVSVKNSLSVLPSVK